jgi:hypothetical protein
LTTLSTSDNHVPKLDVEGSNPFARSTKGRLLGICHTPAHIYHSWEPPSCSRLQLLLKSPLKFYHLYERGQRSVAEESEALRFGSLFHEWALLQEAFWEVLHVAPSTVCTATGNISPSKAKAWLAEIPEGEFACSPADKKQLEEMIKVLLRNREVRTLINDRIDAEFNCRWLMNGYSVRGRIDGMTPYCLFDWKTTREENPCRDWARSAICKWYYHMQAAMYEDAMEAMGMEPAPMRFIVTSTTWPHECAVIQFPDHVREAGRRLCLRLLDELESRRAWDFWQRHEAQGVITPEVPAHWLKEV